MKSRRISNWVRGKLPQIILIFQKNKYLRFLPHEQQFVTSVSELSYYFNPYYLFSFSNQVTNFLLSFFIIISLFKKINVKPSFFSAALPSSRDF